MKELCKLICFPSSTYNFPAQNKLTWIAKIEELKIVIEIFLLCFWSLLYKGSYDFIIDILGL